MRTRLGLGMTLLMATTALGWSGCRGDFVSMTVLPEDGGRVLQEGGGEVDGGGGACPTTSPIDPATFPWKPARGPQDGKCRAEDVAAMRAYLAENPKATNDEFEAFVKNRDTTCHECVFDDASSATWPPVPVQNGKVVTFDVGACVEILSGSMRCGRAIQNAWDCEFAACARCRSSAQVEPCRAKSRSGACKAAFDASRLGCADIPAAVEEACGSPFDSIRVQCVSSASDAGKL